MKYWGREKELEVLEQLTSGNSTANLIVISGEMNIGKTTLVEKLLANRKGTLYFKISMKTPHMLLAEFTEVLVSQINGFEGAKDVKDFRSFFAILFLEMSKKGLNVVFDDAMNLYHVDSHALCEFKTLWDQHYETLYGSVIFVGYDLRYMYETFRKDEDLHTGRSVEIINLNPLSPNVVADILNDNGVDSDKHLLFYYTLFGGHPYYYSLLYHHELFHTKNPYKLIDILFCQPHSLLRDEGYNILVKQLGKCCPAQMSILKAIACGTSKMTKIAEVTGIKETSISKYLGQMVKNDQILDHRIPVTVTTDSPKIGRYHIIHPQIRFWFRYFFKIQGFISSECNENLTNTIKDHLDIYMEYTFREMISDFIRAKHLNSGETLNTNKNGGYWDKHDKHTVDFVVIDRNHTGIRFISCRVNGNRFTQEDAEHLLNSGARIIKKYPNWNESYILIHYDELGSRHESMIRKTFGIIPHNIRKLFPFTKIPAIPESNHKQGMDVDEN